MHIRLLAVYVSKKHHKQNYRSHEIWYLLEKYIKAVAWINGIYEDFQSMSMAGNMKPQAKLFNSPYIVNEIAQRFVLVNTGCWLVVENLILILI